MNYYPFHIGDYTAHTAHLDPMEDLAYRRMLDLYYRTQAPLHDDVQRIAKLIRLPGESETIRAILVEFFQHTADGWTNTRADKEIAAYMRMADGGAKGAAKRWAKPSDSPPMPTPCPPYPNPNANHNHNHNQSHNQNQKEEPRQVAAPPPAGLDLIAWERWAKYRKSIKKPIKPASVEAAQVALAKHGPDQAAVVEQSIANGWQGLFPLKHGTQPGAPPPMNRQEALEARNREVARRYIENKRAGVVNAGQ